MRYLSKLLCSFFIFFLSLNATKAQTTLAAGDIAFTGYIAQDPSLADQFSFVLLTNVTNNTVIKFTDYGWRTDLNAFNSGPNLESELTLTITGNLNAGTEITISGTTATIAGGGSAGTVVYSTGAGFVAGTLSLNQNGDQIFAYQNSFASPTFISGIHMNVYSTTNSDPTTTSAALWDGVIASGSLNGTSSGKPAALTTGTNAIWIGTSGDITSERDNGRFTCGPDVSTAVLARAAINNPANWLTSSTTAGFTLPTGCNYLGILSAPVITGNPTNASICAGAGTTLTGAATGATSYQWQVSIGGGPFTNLSDDVNYSGTGTTTLTLSNIPIGFHGNQYRMQAINGSGTVNTTAATLTVNAIPVAPTLAAKIPAASSVADGTPVSATFNAGSGGTGCTDDFRYTTNGGATYLPYTPGSNISTTGLAAGTGFVTIEGRRANCSAGCQGSYVALASWYVTPLPAGATTLNAGDIAFSGYTSTSAGDDFSFVLLRNIGTGTQINFTNNGWLSTNVFRTGEETVTWTSNASYPAGTEIVISGLTATLAAGGSAGTVTGTALGLNPTGDQILAYRGTAASPTFITAIHMNVYTAAGGDPVTTTAAAWDGTANNINASALPTGLTTGFNAIWIGTQGVSSSERLNARYGNCANPATFGAISILRSALNNQANWSSDNSTPPSFSLPTGCSYLGIGTAPNISVSPSGTSVCEGANASFSATVTGATTLQWQVDNGGGFANIANNATYSGANTATLNINATPLSLNGYIYRLVASNGSGSATSGTATLTVTALPVAPSLLAKTPASASVADGTPVSATFNAGSGGTGCTDDYRYTTDGGLTYLPYTPGANISTTGLAAGSGFVFIEGRRANCSAGCQGVYRVLAQWYVTPLPVAATTLNAGDIAFSGYTSTTPNDDFSFVLLRNIGPGTQINFTNNGWLSTNVFGTGEETIAWTAPAGGLTAGTEIKISGLTASRQGGGAAGTVTGTPLTLSVNGDQILAYRGTVASPTFISAIHMNVYTVANGDPVTTTAAAWDGTAVSTNASALPTGLTTGVNAIWIGTQGNIASEFDNSRFGNCAALGVSGPLVGLRAALNNQANWISDNNIPPSFTLPTGCNYLSMLCPTITVTNPATATGTAGTAFSQTFTATGGTGPHTFTTASTLPTGLTLSTAGVLNGIPTQSGTFPIIVTATEAGGSGCSGNGATYNLVIGCPANTATATPSSQTICSGANITDIVLSGGLTGTTYNWTRDNNAFVTGIAASGSGDITGALTNTTSAPVTVTFTITPVIYGCNGTTTTATVVVNPTPDAVATPPSQSICSGANITNIVLSGSVTGTQFNWTRDNTGTVTGIAGSGSGNISGALSNTTNAPITVTFTITPTANSCPGTPITATVVVNPIPDATAAPASQSRCSGSNIQQIVFSGSVGSTSFDWVRDNVGTVGGNIPANGSGNISGFFTNNTASPITVTFTITPNANGCPGAPITATVTVNPLPLATINGGGAIVCQNSNFSLSANTDPNYTYAWGRSLFGNPFSALGTNPVQPIDQSGNYLLTVTNQYGCIDTAMTTVVVADYVFNGSLATGDAVQTGRLNRFAVVSTCASPKACPLTFTTTGSRLYDSYTVTNPRNVPVCATIGITSYCGTNIFSVAYSGSYNPTSLCTNYLADPGSSFLTSGYYEATIPANGTIVVVVHEVNPGTGCTGYSLSVAVPRDDFITVTPNDTVCSGTPVVLTAPPANSYLWTPGGATTQSINPTPATGTNTYSVQSVYGNRGCTATLTEDIVVNPTPDVTAVSNQYFCNNSTAGPIVLSGAVPGTTFSWTNTNTAIGLGANGTGDIPSFTATNGTGAPISGTITVTPTVGSCTGTPITFTITVANESMITSVTNDTICAPGGVVSLAATATGLINWYDSLTGGSLLNTGNTYSPNVSATDTFYVESLVTAGPVTNLLMPAQNNTFPGNVRGYVFTAPADFVITSLYVPTTASSGPQHIAVVKFNGNVPPPIFSATTNAFTTLFLTRNNASAGRIATNIPVHAGEVIGILGNRANLNSYGPGDFNTTVMGLPVQLQRLGMQFQLGSTNPRDIFREPGAGTSISRIEFEYAPLVCNSSPRVPVTAVVNPQPVATATPASQTVCSGAITPIVLTSTVAGTTFTWTRDNTGTATGIAASGTGDISGTLTNTTTSPVTVTFTITPTSPDGCVGPNITATVTVQAIPTITCPANITTNTDAGQCSAVVTYSPTVTGIPVPSVTYTFTGATTGSGSGNGSGAAFNKGVTTVEIIATNVCGADTCSFTVTVNDNENPTITCPAPVTVSCAADVPPVNTGSVTAGDNCPGVVVTHISDVISAQTCANRFTITRTYRATDAASNFVECTQTITVNDITPPVLTCPAPVTVSCAADVPPVNIADVTGVSDNCAGAVTVTWQGDVITNQTCANRYQVTRTYRATDVCGNFTECTQIITVNDQTAPIITCPAPVTVSCTGDVPPVNIAAVTATDNCAGVVTITWEGDVVSSQTCLNRYTITRTYRATDVCGNFAECTQIITVDDQTAPIITCPAPVTVSCAGAVPPPNTGAITATDNCAGSVSVTWISDVISNQTCDNRYTLTRTYRATDACGNFAECTQTITVDDQTPPVLTCPAPISVTCSGDVPAPNIALVTGVSDNCGGPVTVTWVSDVISNQTCANRYTLTRTYRATDACGNFTNCTQVITVNDATPPVLTCPPSITVSCAGEVPAPDISLVTAVSDNCAGAVTVTWVSDVITNQTCANRYQVNRTYRATDVCGNFAQCVQIIYVNDVTAPTITCPAPVTVSCASAVPAATPGAIVASDNCGTVTVTHVGDVISSQSCANRYTITRTYRATDACGNFTSCTQIITVNDQTAPVITCPANITVSTPLGSCTATVNFNVTATDNCGGAVTITSVPASGTVFAIGTTLVTSTATDACGNTSTCTFTVTVNDAQLPVITTQPAQQNICVGTAATFSVVSTNTLGYQWQTKVGNNWLDIPLATLPNYTIPITTLPMNNDSFRVVIRGRCINVISNAVALRVNPLPNVTLSAAPLTALQPGQTTTITATATPAGGSFAWIRDGVPMTNGVTGNTLGPITVDGIGAYRVVYTDLNGCRNSSFDIFIIGKPSGRLWVLPNPNAGRFEVRYFNTKNEPADLNIYAEGGQRVFHFKYTTGTTAYSSVSVDLRNQPAGTYTAVLTNGGGVRLDAVQIVINR